MPDPKGVVTFQEVANLSAEHVKRFGTGGVTLISYPPGLYGEIAQRLENAIETGKACNDAELCELFGIAPPPEGSIA